MRLFVLPFVFVVMFLARANAQLNFDYTAGKFLIKGKIIDAQSQKPIPLANILILNSGKGITVGEDGTFNLYVYRKDTLKITSTGYLPKLLHIYDLDSTKYYTLDISLFRDAIKLKDVTIYPYSRDEFDKKFMDLKIARVNIPGIAPPKYSHKTPIPKFNNPISLLYEHVKRRRAANPDFRP